MADQLQSTRLQSLLDAEGQSAAMSNDYFKAIGGQYLKGSELVRCTDHKFFETRSEYFHKVGCKVRNVTPCVKRISHDAIDHDTLALLLRELMLSSGQSEIRDFVAGKVDHLMSAPPNSFPCVCEKHAVYVDAALVRSGPSDWSIVKNLPKDGILAVEVFVAGRVTDEKKVQADEKKMRTKFLDDSCWMSSFIARAGPSYRDAAKKAMEIQLTAGVVLDWSPEKLATLTSEQLGIKSGSVHFDATIKLLGTTLKQRVDQHLNQQVTYFGDLLVVLTEVTVAGHGSMLRSVESDKMRYFVQEILAEEQSRLITTNINDSADGQDSARAKRVLHAYQLDLENKQRMLDQKQGALEAQISIDRAELQKKADILASEQAEFGRKRQREDSEMEDARAKLQGLRTDLDRREAKLAEEQRAFQDHRTDLDQREAKLAEEQRAFQDHQTDLDQREAKFAEEQRGFQATRETTMEQLQKETEALRLKGARVQAKIDEIKGKQASYVRNVTIVLTFLAVVAVVLKLSDFDIWFVPALIFSVVAICGSLLLIPQPTIEPLVICPS